MEKANRFKDDHSLIVPVAGHTKALYFDAGIHACGEIVNGVGFEFEREGCWVVDLETLRDMVALADEVRSAILQADVA